MKFKSTRGDADVTFKEAVLRCLPDDGGLYVPLETPDLRPQFMHMDADTGYGRLSALVLSHLLRGEISPEQERQIAEKAFPFEPELVRLDERFSALKLYHGPTGVFKDFGIAFLAAMLDVIRDPAASAPLMVISAVRGDIGFSLARAFRRRPDIICVILCPSGPILALEEADFVPNGGNIIPIQVDGTLDDCSHLIRALIEDRQFSDPYRLTSANSINVGRLIPQAFYFLYAFLQLKRELGGGLVFSVPSGNLGNLIAGLYAWRFGMPLDGIIAAMNVNNPLGNFLQGKTAQTASPTAPVTTASPALDVRFPVNFERLATFQSEASLVMNHMVYPHVVSDDKMKAAMKEAWTKYSLLLDPHGALAYAAAKEHEKSEAFVDADSHIVFLATGHPAKYARLIENVTGERLPVPERLASLSRPVQAIARIPPQLDLLESAIASCF